MNPFLWPALDDFHGLETTPQKSTLEIHVEIQLRTRVRNGSCGEVRICIGPVRVYATRLQSFGDYGCS